MTDRTIGDADISFGVLRPGIRTALRPGGGWFVSNSGWVVGTNATLVIDTFASERRTLELLEEVQQTREAAGAADTDLLLALTHSHGDHANGAGIFEAAGATVMATAAAGDELMTMGIQRFPGLLANPDWGDVAPPKAVKPLAGTQVIDLGGVDAELVALPTPAHSPGDVAVRFADQQVLFAGDLVWNAATPLAVSGSVTGWLDQLDGLAALSPKTIVPGHGPVGGPALIDSTRRYLDWVVGLAREVLAGGREMDMATLQARRSGLEWEHWSAPERDLSNIPRAVADLSGEPFDMMAAMVAMVAGVHGPIHLEG